jgi:hypothetical protein
MRDYIEIGLFYNNINGFTPKYTEDSSSQIVDIELELFVNKFLSNRLILKQLLLKIIST